MTRECEVLINPEAVVVSEAIQTEVEELVCEILELEQFELTRTRALAAYQHGLEQPNAAIAATLECAFGVTFRPGEVASMVNLERVFAALEAALRTKRQHNARGAECAAPAAPGAGPRASAPGRQLVPVGS